MFKILKFLIFSSLITNLYAEKSYTISSLNLYARMLVGIQNPTTQIKEDIPKKLLNILKYQSYTSHYNEMQKNWNDVEKKRFSHIRKWVSTEIQDSCNENTIFYPFSGPDILTVILFYPCGKQYILFGLEPPGKIRFIEDENEKTLNRYFYYIRSSLHSILKYSFFRTNDMKIDFFQKLDGITPILLAFLAYSEKHIIKISTITLIPNGEVVERKEKGIPGVQIFFNDKNQNTIKNLIYIQINIQDSELLKNKYFLNWLKGKGKLNTFIKSASYLMHRDTFSLIRDQILKQSVFLIQDDSGIPLRFFERNKWNLSFYGNYIKPIPLFRIRYQNNLRKIYINDKNITPLTFGFGYQYQPERSNLMVARKIE